MSKRMISIFAVVLALAWTAACSRTTESYRSSAPNTESYSASTGTTAATMPNGSMLQHQGTVQAYNSSTHVVTMEDGTQYILSDSAIKEMPNPSSWLAPGKQVAFNYFDQNGQKVIASMQSQVRHGSAH